MRAWLRQIKVADPVQRPFAELLQILLIAQLVFMVPVFFSALLTMPDPGQRAITGAVVGFLVAASAIALAILRRGHLRSAFLIVAVALLAAGLQGLSSLGYGAGTHFLIMLAVPLVLSTLLGSRAVTIGLAVVTLALLGLILVLEAQGSPLVAWQPFAGSPGAAAVSNFALTMSLLLVFLDRYGQSFRRSLTSAQAREQELETLREDLERTVAERTAALQATVDQLTASQETIRELGAPVLPVLPGVLVAPLIGALDSARAAALSESALRAVAERRATHLILDITGVVMVDTQVAQALLHTAEAVRLLGAQPALVGIRAEVAQTLVALGLTMDSFVTYPSLQEAVIDLARRGGVGRLEAARA